MDVLESIEHIQRYVEGMSREDFEEDIVVRDAVERRIEIIAEATKHIPSDLKATRPEIPWPAVMSMRNFLSHEYFAVAHDSVWNVVQNHLVPLEQAMRAMLATLPEEPE